MTEKRTLNDWLDFILTIHDKKIDLGLERIRAAANCLQIHSFPCPVITVTGTNGKGSCVAFLEQIYLKAGYKTGTFSSPSLFSFNEQIRLNGENIDDLTLCEAFDEINQKGNNIALTLFEFTTLAALLIFQKFSPDVIILEVGLGGRLDAVNIIDPDIAIISTIDIDHVKFLGHTREQIALEKAGICRSSKPAICGDPAPPKTLLTYTETNEIPLFQQGKDFNYSIQNDHWSWRNRNQLQENLPLPQLHIQNASTCLMALSLLQERLPVDQEAIHHGIAKTNLPGRCQKIEIPIMHIFDVAHNPQAARLLAKNLEQQTGYQKTRAIFSMLHDKDISGVISPLKQIIDEWFIAEITLPKNVTPSSGPASLARLKQTLMEKNIQNIYPSPTLGKAYQNALSRSGPKDRLVVFGSFYTVSSVCKEANLIA